MKKIFIALICILTFTPADAQKKPIEERVSRGKLYRTKYPNENLICTKKTSHVSFLIPENKTKKKNRELDEDGKLESNIKTTSEFISLKDNYIFAANEFYNGISDIKSIMKYNESNFKSFCNTTDNPYQEDGIFHHDYRFKNYSVDLGPLGSKSKIEVIKLLYDTKYIESLFFHDEYIIEESEIIIDVPFWINIDIREFNFKDFNITHQIHVIEENATKFTRHTFTAKNIAAFSNEKNAAAIPHTYPHLILICQNFTDVDGLNKPLISNLTDLYRWYRSLTIDLNYSDSSYIQKAKSLTSGLKTDYEKVKAIYYWIQDNIKYIAFESGIAGFKPESANDVFNKKYGDCKGMANLTKAMLSAIGYDAKLAWIGTKEIPYKYDLPSLKVDNHMICVLKINDKTYFIDGTEKYQSLGKNAFRIRGKQVLIENNDMPLIDSVPSNFALTDAIKSNFTYSILGENLIGKGEIKMEGDKINEFLYYSNYIKKDEFLSWQKEFLSNNEKGIEYKNIICKGCESRDQNLIFSCEKQANRKVNLFENEMYIQFDFGDQFESFSVDENRVSDFTFNEYFYSESKCSFIIPTNWKLKHYPQNISIQNEDFNIELKIEIKNGVIIYSKKIHVFTGVIRLKNYAVFAKAIEDLKIFTKENIVLEVI